MEGLKMNKRGAGVSFCFIAAFLFSVRYISAAIIFGSGVSSWNQRLFNALLEYIGSTLVVLSVISLGVGVTYLLMAEKE